MKEDTDQDIDLALKQDIEYALKKGSEPSLKADAVPRTQRERGAPARRTNIFIIIGITTLTAACIVFIGYVVFLWNFINLDHFLDMNRNSNNSTLTGRSPEEPEGGKFLDTYNPNQVLAMKPVEREAVYEKAVEHEWIKKQEHIAGKIKDMGIVLKKTMIGKNRVPQAIMTENGGSEQIYCVGDVIAEARVMGIYPKKVVLNLDGKRVMLNQEGFGPKQEEDDVFTDGVMLVSDTQAGSISSLSEDAVQLMSRFNSGTLLTDELPLGFKVSSVQTGPLSYAGLREGDLLISINAIPLKHREDMIRAYASLSDQSPNPVEFERDGNIMRADVQL
jgi:type II secretion system protein C